MQLAIRNPHDVEEFTRMLVREGVTFHPDTDFNDYINIHSGKLTFTKKEAATLNQTLQKCFEVCESNSVDIYEIALEATISESRKLQIPLFN